MGTNGAVSTFLSAPVNKNAVFPMEFQKKCRALSSTRLDAYPLPAHILFTKHPHPGFARVWFEANIRREAQIAREPLTQNF